jgi:hypothetical protein
MTKTTNLHTNRFILTALMLAILASLLLAAVRPAAAADTASLNIVSVEKGQSVTIRVVDMAANKEFRVLMNTMGTLGVKGIEAGTGKTNSDGSFTKTFLIPADLKRESRIAIRIEATDKTGWYSYNWFVNSTSGSSNSSGGTGSVTPPAGNLSGSSNLSIVDVEEDVSVEIQARNLVANRAYQVWFDWKNRSGTVKAAQSGTIRSDNNGKIVASVRMPSALVDRQEVRLRLQDGSSLAAYAWFLNRDSDENSGSGAEEGSISGIPYLVIGAVVENDSVAVTAFNLPKRTEFDVYMGKFGTQGEDGIYVETVKTGKSGSSIEATFDIPKKLWDKEKIAIRLEAADGSDTYVYSWFYNTTDSTGQ